MDSFSLKKIPVILWLVIRFKILRMINGGTTFKTDSIGNWHNKVVLAKLNANGLLQWSKYFSCSDITQMFALTPVGNGFIFGGLTSTNTNVSNYHLLLVRLDENGDTLW